MQYNFGPDADKSNACPAGMVRVECATCIEKVSSTGNPMWEATFQVIEPAVHAECMALYSYFVFAPTAERMLYRDLAALGCPVKVGEQFTMSCEDMVGKKAVAKIIHEDYKGEMRPRIAKFMLDTGPGSLGGEAASSTGEVDTSAIPF